jgi:hypothetical protein
LYIINVERVVTFKKPDLNAPRYRPNRLNLTNLEFYEKFQADNPKYNHISISQFKEVITTFNGLIWQNVLSNRDGVELPEQLGFIFIGTCPRPTKKQPVDYKRSIEHNIKLQNMNWESDQYLAKIFYTTFENKYRFRNHELWMFDAVRDFRRTVAQTYPKQWKMYVMIDNKKKISRIFRMQNFKQMKTQETASLLETYDEFNLD